MCLGIKVEDIPPSLCFECPVKYPCIWTAIVEDDRLGESTFFIRGGLSANKRQELWCRSGRNAEKAFNTSVIQMERARSGEQAKQKNNRNK